jgi:hypothetical protein
MGTSTTVATGRFPVLARLAVALGFAATLLVGQALVFDSSADAKPKSCDSPECAYFDMENDG